MWCPFTGSVPPLVYTHPMKRVERVETMELQFTIPKLSAAVLALIGAAGTGFAGVANAQDFAEDINVSVEAGLMPMLIDRGEQLSGTTVDSAVGVGVAALGGEVYGAVYRITPVGDNETAFADEFDYTIGYAFETDAFSVDVSYNELTFPGQSEENSTEVFGEVGFNAPLSPAVMAYYDLDTENTGIEINAGPEWVVGQATAYALVRAGTFTPGDDSADRSYGGIEAGLVRAVNERTELGSFLRFDQADEDSFAEDYVDGQIASFTNTGFAFGVTLSMALGG